jgi:hypothetical protein
MRLLRNVGGILFLAFEESRIRLVQNFGSVIRNIFTFNQLVISEEIQSPLFATTTYRVFIVHELHYMFRSYIDHLQVYQVYKMLKIITVTLTDPLILYKIKYN